ncbi:hypothetical protein Cni_G28378 [Canna indica]|uniref:Plastid division protein PDV2 n=1 Tax=Canna indica TaxID=4628 RepID=A0AAQ3QSA0_9LILI|nr:hypothetical protein Cni_G28378 [Canna indica]
MEGEEIGLVLARASELRSKISLCIAGSGGDPEGEPRNAGGRTTAEDDAEDDEAEEEAESLVGIRDALDSLERQLGALQSLQHQQRYEKESILGQIDRSRMVLLSKLKEYKGEELDVIHEVAAFAGEAVERDDGLVLPPYPMDLPDLFVLDDIGAGSRFMKNKPSCNGSIANSKDEGNETASRTDKNPGNKTSNGIRHVMGLVVKSAITFAGVVWILALSGYQPILRKNLPTKRQSSIRCPQGKFLVIEDGKARCIVKERVEIPFESDVPSPNIRYGFG